METINERLSALRRKLQLTQAEFAGRINRASNTISEYEKNDKSIPDRAIADICREFDANEEWLRTGKGMMFKPPQSQNTELAGELGKLLAGKDEFTKELFLRYLKMPPEFKKQFEDFLYGVAEKLPKPPEK